MTSGLKSLQPKFLRKGPLHYPLSGIPEVDFLDPALLSQEKGILNHSSSGWTQFALPCAFTAELTVHHSVQVALTRVQLTSNLFGEEADSWVIEYEEDSSIRFKGDISGRMIPFLTETAETQWKMDEESQVSASGSYRTRRMQVERLNIDRPSAVQITASGEGPFQGAFRLGDLVESSLRAADGSVEFQLRTPPIEMKLEKIEQNLLTQELTRSQHTPWVFFPTRFTKISWPSQEVQFPHRSEVTRQVRGSFNGEVDIPAQWTSEIHLQVNLLTTTTSAGVSPEARGTP